jgi:hypothetical protein
MNDPLLDPAADAALALAADRPWGEITLRSIAEKAGVSFPELYERAFGKTAVVNYISRRLDHAALATADGDAEADLHDRLFDAAMARIEAMEPHRHALIAIQRIEGAAQLAKRLARTARALLEAAGVDTSGARGAARLAAMTAVWARVLQVWRDDEGALNRTMAEIDKRLKQMRERLKTVGAGF